MNILAPLFLGSLFYLIAHPSTYAAYIKSYLPDGLWAYAFMNCILITWDRNMNWLWILAAFFISISFEILQYNQVINGTGDIFDVLTYIIFFAIALQFNFYFKLRQIKPRESN